MATTHDAEIPHDGFKGPAKGKSKGKSKDHNDDDNFNKGTGKCSKCGHPCHAPWFDDFGDSNEDGFKGKGKGKLEDSGDENEDGFQGKGKGKGKLEDSGDESEDDFKGKGKGKGDGDRMARARALAWALAMDDVSENEADYGRVGTGTE